MEYHEADGSSLPFPEESLDAAFANMYLHHTPDPLAAIREMVRVLRPGGRLVITDMEEHAYTWMKEEMADVWQGFPLEQVRAWFQEAGLVNVIVDATGQSCCAESADRTLTDGQGREARIKRVRRHRHPAHGHAGCRAGELRRDRAVRFLLLRQHICQRG